MKYPIPFRIRGIGRYLPDRVVTNAELEKLLDVPAGWIEKKTGVQERRWVSGETNAFMGARAAEEALRNAGLPIQDVDLILNASGTPQRTIPDGGPLLQRELGVGKSGIPCMSIHSTCLSFLSALDVASTLLTTGRYETILISSSEIASLGINLEEPKSAALFGDAAAAVVVSKPQEDESSALFAARFETYGEAADLAVLMAGNERFPYRGDTKPEDMLFQMDGRRLFKKAHVYGRGFIDRVRPGLSQGLGDISLVVPHQTTMAGLRSLEKHGMPFEKVVVTLPFLGNSIAASIPAAFYQAIQDDRLQRGDQVLMIGTGAGLTLGAVILTY